MPSSKCGGLIPSKRKRKTAARPTINHGVQSVSASHVCQFSSCSRQVGKSASVASWPLLVGAVRILVTGGCGFIGSNFIRYVLQHYKPASVTNVDVLTYAGNPANLDGVVEEHGERYEFFKADIANPDQMNAMRAAH